MAAAHSHLCGSLALGTITPPSAAAQCKAHCAAHRWNGIIGRLAHVHVIIWVDARGIQLLLRQGLQLLRLEGVPQSL